jgi:hypothetical protein
MRILAIIIMISTLCILSSCTPANQGTIVGTW